MSNAMLSKALLATLMRFAVSGGLATLTYVVVFVVLVEWLGLRPVLAATPAFVLSVLVSYGANYHWTFAADGPHRLLLPRFVIVALTGLALNQLITYSVVDLAGYWYGYALMLVVLIVPLLTFTLSRVWVFR